MPSVVVAPSALEDLEYLIVDNSLPEDTRERVRALLRPLEEFPEMGPSLPGRWSGFRFLLGPWPWMLIVYTFDDDADLVAIVTVQDARKADSPTSGP